MEALIRDVYKRQVKGYALEDYWGTEWEKRYLDCVNEDVYKRQRVICSFEEDVFFLAKCLKDQSDIEIITEKDYISHPKPNGYRSLHQMCIRDRFYDRGFGERESAAVPLG